MAKDFLIFRLRCYFRENGLVRTIGRSFELLWQSTFRKRRFLYYVDLPKLPDEQFKLREDLTVECKKGEDEISEEELNTLIFYRRERIIKRQLKDRFSKGASLWLIKLNAQVVGIVWSVREATIEPYYFPLTSSDVHLFDNEVFHDYCGRGINSQLINYVLFALKKQGMVRAYIETAVRNVREIRSLAKTYFRNYGSAIGLHIFGHNISFWSKTKRA